MDMWDGLISGHGNQRRLKKIRSSSYSRENHHECWHSWVVKLPTLKEALCGRQPTSFNLMFLLLFEFVENKDIDHLAPISCMQSTIEAIIDQVLIPFPNFHWTLGIMVGLSVGEELYRFPFITSYFDLLFSSLFHVFKILSISNIWSSHCMWCQVCMPIFQLLLNFPEFLKLLKIIKF